MLKTAYAKRTTYKPIDFFFRGVSDAKTKKVVFVDAFQILNDRYLGRMSVCNYFFIAENSVRINELNVIALDELQNYHLVMRENFLIPEKVTYSLPITTRFLENEKEFEILLSTIKDNGYKKGDLVISFNSNTIMKIDDEAKKRYDRLRRLGYKTCINGFGEEFNSLDVFARFNFDYLRLEAQYFDSTQPKKRILNMLVKYCGANKIGLIVEGVDTPGQLNRFRKEGVKLVTGKAVSKLSRWVTNEFLGLPELKGEKKEAYLKKLEKELTALENKEQAEYEEMMRVAREKAKADATTGKVRPVAPRPELVKSPYQIRLEQQKESARRAALARAEKAAERKEEVRLTREEYNEQRLIEEARHGMFEGDVQSMLALGAHEDEKAKADAKTETKETAKKKTVKADLDAEKKLIDEIGHDGLGSLGGDAMGGFGGKPIIRHDEPTDDKPEKEEKTTKSTEKKSKKKKDVVADTDKENKLLGEFKGSSLDKQLGIGGGFGGFGINLSFKDEDEEEIVGHYNEKGQWVDEDGYIYNGYFDEKGEWHDYETFDAKEEGHYNDDGQWVDKDGKVYDGYFDENGRWIDYTYVDDEGNTVSNGYFDEKIKKWVPYGYFDDEGVWRLYE